MGDRQGEEKSRNPWDKAGLISRIFFWWCMPFLGKGFRSEIQENDLFECSAADSSELLGNALQKEWDKELEKMAAGKEPSLRKAVFRAFGSMYALTVVQSMFEEGLLRVLQPLALGWMIQYLESSSDDRQTYVLASGLGVCLLSAIYMVSHHSLFFYAQRIGMKLRIACCNMVYRKALKLDQVALEQTTVGQIVNVVASDVAKFDQASLFMPYIITAPIQAVVITAILWQDLGVTTLAGLAFLLLYLPFQGLMGKLFSDLRAKTTVHTDERICLTEEMIAGMKILKMYAWETPFSDRVIAARKKEIGEIKQTMLLRGLNMALFFVSSKIIVFLCFVSLVLIGGRLTAHTVFVSISLFNNLRLTMTLFLPYAVCQGSESLVSLDRIQQFLVLKEKSPTCVESKTHSPPSESCGIWMDSLCAKWTPDQEDHTLDGLSATVAPSQLLVVTGPVGSGKTSLLMALLGELPTCGGSLKLKGKISYASQEPWLVAGSIRENVLFGSPFDAAKYRTVLRACALEKDIAQLPLGDGTNVGERGVSLSGGQRARINLARAVYVDADVYLLDDPLSAVDASVAKHLFDRCICGYLKSKVRVLVTHQVQFLKHANRILLLSEGKCQASESQGPAETAGMRLNTGALDQQGGKRLSVRKTLSLKSASSFKLNRLALAGASICESSVSLTSQASVDTNRPVADKIPEGEEQRQSGSLSTDVYMAYIKAGGGWICACLWIIINLTSQALFSGIDYWLAKWTDAEDQLLMSEALLANKSSFINSTMTIEMDFPRSVYLEVYCGLTAALFLASLIRSISLFAFCMKASIRLHQKVFESIVRTPMMFFETVSLGSILNRFTRDMSCMDDLIPPIASDFFLIFTQILGVVTLVMIVNPWLAIPSGVLLGAFFFSRRFYVRIATAVKRLEGTRRSPVLSHLSTSLYGLTTIRAFGAESTFEKEFDKWQDNHTAAWFMFISSARAFAIGLDSVTIVYLTCVVLSAIFSLQGEPAGDAGLSVSVSLILIGAFQWCLRQSTELDSQLTSVERLVEYTKLEPEAPLESAADQKPPPDWPQHGAISFREVVLRYTKYKPAVLKNLNCNLLPGEKVGIVGRTGAGKSSIIAALFRLTEPSGTISIDGVPINSIGLHDLRRKISIIPQDPVIFMGTVRGNLDPFNNRTDEELWQVLEEVRLKRLFEELTGGLQTELSEGGSNFSLGQRQLLCLARAILRQNKILVLDEATANVDHETDALIQETIRNKFHSCTVLTIAHRLNTIMDCDKVMVLDAGKIVELDEPYTLLEDEGGPFSTMVQHTGQSMAEKLYDMALSAHLARTSH